MRRKCIKEMRICPNCQREFPVYTKYPQQKFCSCKCVNNGKRSARWKGGKYVDGSGYLRVKSRSHPFCDKQGYVCEHRLVVEKMWGRYLLLGEYVHHINGNKQDNRYENLEVMTAGEHRTRHNLENNPFKGKKHTDGHKKYMSQLAKRKGFGKWNIGKPRPIEVIRRIQETKRLKRLNKQFL